MPKQIWLDKSGNKYIRIAVSHDIDVETMVRAIHGRTNADGLREIPESFNHKTHDYDEHIKWTRKAILKQVKQDLEYNGIGYYTDIEVSENIQKVCTEVVLNLFPEMMKVKQ